MNGLVIGSLSAVKGGADKEGEGEGEDNQSERGIVASNLHTRSLANFLLLISAKYQV